METKIGPRKTQPIKIAAENNDRDANESHYWQSSLCAYWFQAIVTTIAATVGVIGLFILNSTLKATKKAADAAKSQAQTALVEITNAREQFELSERPWVSINPIAFSDLRFSQNGSPSLTIKWALNNSGHSQAAYAHIEWKLVPLRADDKIFTAPLTAQKHLCMPLRSHTKPDFDAFILFPDSLTERQQGTSISAADVQSQETLPKDDRPFAVFFVLGCVDYRFEFESGHHQTGFVYELRKSELRNGFMYDRIYPGPNVTVPRSVLSLDSWPFGDGFYAD